MSNTSILLRDHKAYVVLDQWDGDKQIYHYDEKETGTLLGYLTLFVEIGRNFTFGDLLTIVANDGPVFNSIFAGTLGFYDLHLYLAEANKPSKKKLPKYGVHFLELGWAVEMHDSHKSKRRDDDVDPYFTEYVEFHGRGPNKDHFTKKVIPDERWSLSFAKINELAPLPLKLDNDFTISHWTYSVDAKGESTPKVNQVKMGTRDFTVFDILNAIFHEISFFGDPVSREKENKKLTDRVKKLDADKKDGVTDDGRSKKTGKKLFYSMDEVEASWERSRKRKEKRDADKAPAMIKQYADLLKQHNDPEVLAVKRYYMENRGNSQFIAGAKKLNEQYQEA